MHRMLSIVSLVLVLLLAGGCSSRPISKTYHHLKKGYNTTKQVYRTTKAVADFVNPLEYIYVSESGELLTPDGEPFVTRDAMFDLLDQPTRCDVVGGTARSSAGSP